MNHPLAARPQSRTPTPSARLHQRMAGFVVRLYTRLAWQDAEHEGALSRQLVGRLAAILYVLCALAILAGLLLPAPPGANRGGIAAVSGAALLTGVVLWFLPWGRWRRSFSLWFVLIAFTLIVLLNHFGGGDHYRYTIFFLVAFSWIGMGHPPGTSLRFVPLLAVASLLPLWSAGLLSWLSAGTTVFTIPVCVLVSEMLAWISRQLQLAHRQLQRREQYFRVLSEHAGDLVSVLDAGAVIRYASASYASVLGYAPASMQGRSAFELVDPRDVSRLQELFVTAMDGAGAVVRTECRVRHADGSWRVLEVVGNNRLADPAVRGIIVNARDVTRRKEADDALRHQALSDALTGLPNRTLLCSRIEEAIGAPGGDHAPVALLLLDLDRFKEVNDTFGHHYGDVVLCQVGRRLRDALGESDTVARLGGDEFAMLLPAADAESAGRVGHTLGAALAAPFVVDGHAFDVGGSIGIALSPDHGTDALTLLRCADVAMYAAKRSGRGVVLYDVTLDQYSADRLALVAELRQAINRGDLVLHYQPKLDGATGTICGVEALVRWPHAERGLIPPDQFIPLAEINGLIAPLTLWVLDAAIQQGQAWRREGRDFDVAVNLSTWNLRDPQLPATIAALLRRHSFPPSRLRLEITESSIMADTIQTRTVLAALGALGLHLSIDDFGTGYSSLAYLKRLPVDEIKIDQSFVRHVATDAADAVIVRSTIGMGHSLGLRVVAEGVEDEAALALLREWGCDTAQGYYVSRPLPPRELARWLDTSRWGRAGARAGRRVASRR